MKRFLALGTAVIALATLLCWWQARHVTTSIPTKPSLPALLSAGNEASAFSPAANPDGDLSSVPSIGAPDFHYPSTSKVSTPALPPTAYPALLTTNSPRKRPWDPGFLASFSQTAQGDLINFELVAGGKAVATVRYAERRQGELIYLAGTLTTPESGRFFFQKQIRSGKAGAFVGVVEFPASQRAYRLEPSGPGGATELVERPLGAVLCLKLPRPDGRAVSLSTNPPIAKGPPLRPGDYPSVPAPIYQNGIVVLESLPGTAPVLYLDFQGGYTPTWGGITYARPDVSNDQIRDVWQRVAEDFMPFNINVTTDLGVFLRAREGNRQRLIVTPTQILGPDLGGVSYMGSFNWTGDTPCWVFLTSGKFCAEACSHELGHALGLNHMSLSTNGVHTDYFEGHGSGETSWAPIMGLPYYCNVTQWSRGEYAGADCFEDELATITSFNNNVTYRSDDTGASLARSRYLELYSNCTAFAEGVIERTIDVDTFQFTTSGGSLSLRADPVKPGPNLALQIVLQDAAYTVLVRDCPQDRLWAELNTNLPAGTYTVSVTGAARNDPRLTGFSDYGSLGYYSITGSVANARLPDRFAVPERAPMGTIVGTVSANNPANHPLVYSIVSGNNANTFGINSAGELVVTDNTFLDYDTLASHSQFPVQFELLVNIYDSLTQTLNETSRRVVVSILHVPLPPTITRQPQSLAVPASSNALFSIAATGDQPMVYEWLKNGRPIAGALASSNALTNVQARDAGDYQVVLQNLGGTLTSAVATLTVLPQPPIFTRQPQSLPLFPGNSALFSVEAIGTEPITYQWEHNGADLVDQTNQALGFIQVPRGAGGIYHALARNDAGVTCSTDALLALIPVAAWGCNDIGQTEPRMELTNAVAIAAGFRHSLALRRDGTVFAWGASAATNVPPNLTNVTAVSAGRWACLALRDDGTVVAWGTDGLGQPAVVPRLSNVVAVATSGDHHLALKADSTVVAWGLNQFQQAIVPPGLSNVVAIAAGESHSLALRGDGKVIAWGDNSSGQAAVPSSLEGVVAIAAGSCHSLALRSNGVVVAWGPSVASNYGQGDVPWGLSNVVAIAAGGYHSVALTRSGSVVCWGAGTQNFFSFPHFGQSMVPANVTNVSAIAAGLLHTLAFAGDDVPFITEPPRDQTAYIGSRAIFRVAATGALPLTYQWQCNGTNLPGATRQILIVNDVGQDAGYRALITNPQGTAASREARLRMVEGPPIIQTQPAGQTIGAGNAIRLEVTALGTPPLAYQWSFNGTAIAGATNAVLTLSNASPTLSGNYSVIVQNAYGTISSAKALVSVVEVVAWGAGTNFSNYPILGQALVPAGINGVAGIAAGSFHSLALMANGQIQAWGAGMSNNVGSYSVRQSMVPSSLIDAVAVAGGLCHTLALRSNGAVVAWGAGSSPSDPYNYGQSLVPAGLSNVVAITAGDYVSVALNAHGRVVAWGTSSLTNVPSFVTNVAAIAARRGYVLCLKTDGTVVGWGSLPSSIPAGLSSVVAIAAGETFCLALKSDGTVTSWGSIRPLSSILSNVVQIAAGYGHALALRSDGSVFLWGYTNTYGLDKMPPGLTNVAGVASGTYHCLAVLGDGSPRITLPPASRAIPTGGGTTFRAFAVGVPPLRYQWQLNGTNLPGASQSTLRLTNLLAANAGPYRVVVSNPLGAVTSQVANLTILLSLAQALDAPGLTWTTTGNQPWFGQNTIMHDQVGAAQSGPIDGNQQSFLQATVTGPGTLSFWWKVSSESWFDWYTFTINGTQQATTSGEVDWEYKEFALGPGANVLTWVYTKDSSVNCGLDAAWLDQVTFVPAPPSIQSQPVSRTVPAGFDVSLSVGATGTPPLAYQWLRNGVNIPEATRVTLYLPNATRRTSGLYSVQVSNPGGTTLSSNAVVVVRVPQVLRPPAWLPDGTLVLLSGDSDGGVLLPGDLPGFTAQTSTNLVRWTGFTNDLILTNGLLLLLDSRATNHPARFYRIIEQ